jgi:dihydropteroate synthase
MKNRFKSFTINLHGNLLSYDRPVIAGIINVTPDSFFAGSRTGTVPEVAKRVAKMIEEGADWLDLGAYSSRPGADEVSPEEEFNRLAVGMEAIRSVSKEIPVSIDTFRADVARKAITQLGADIINDISGGDLDKDMFDTVAELNVPYILMHMRGTPSTMSQLTEYTDVTADVIRELAEKINRLSLLGVNDIIVDPGFGFAKTLEQNYHMLNQLQLFEVFERPILVGISRKSMIYKALDCTPAEALNGTTILNTISLLNGASILRVHDVAPAVEAMKLVQLTINS